MHLIQAHFLSRQWGVAHKQKYGPKGLQVVGIEFESQDSEAARQKVKDFIAENGINYPVLWGGVTDNKNVLSTIQGLKVFVGYPTTFYIDRFGRIQHVQVGFVSGEPELLEWQVDQMEQKILRHIQ